MIKNVLEYLEMNQKKTPDKIIFLDERNSITYQEFTNIAKLIGSNIYDKLDKTNKSIVIFMEKTVECLVAMMGTVYSGNFYTVMDTKSPEERIKLIYDNKDTGKREIYITKDSNNINNWGVLQYFEKLNSNENAQAKADALLQLYNRKTRKLQIKNAIGDIRVRGGSSVIVQLDLGDLKVQNFMIVEKVKHNFKNGEHFMDLTLIGGDGFVS